MKCFLVTLSCQGVNYETSFLQENTDICEFLRFQILRSRQICGFHCTSKS